MIDNALNMLRVTASEITTDTLGLELKRLAEHANFHFQDGKNVYWYLRHANPNSRSRIGKEQEHVAHLVFSWENPRSRLPKHLDYDVRVHEGNIELRIVGEQNATRRPVPETLEKAAELVLALVMLSCDGHGGSLNGRAFPLWKSRS